MHNWIIIVYQLVVAALYIWLVTRPKDAIESFSATVRYLSLGLGTLAGANAIYCMMDDHSVSAIFTTMLIAIITMIAASFNAGRYYRAKHYKHMTFGLVLGWVSMLIFSIYLMAVELG
jgi:hypothetical protein